MHFFKKHLCSGGILIITLSGSIAADTDPEDPGLFEHPDSDPKKTRIRVLLEQNIDKNHQKIIPKFSERGLFFFVKKV